MLPAAVSHVLGLLHGYDGTWSGLDDGGWPGQRPVVHGQDRIGLPVRREVRRGQSPDPRVCGGLDVPEDGRPGMRGFLDSGDAGPWSRERVEMHMHFFGVTGSRQHGLRPDLRQPEGDGLRLPGDDGPGIPWSLLGVLWLADTALGGDDASDRHAAV